MQNTLYCKILALIQNCYLFCSRFSLYLNIFCVTTFVQFSKLSRQKPKKKDIYKKWLQAMVLPKIVAYSQVYAMVLSKIVAYTRSFFFLQKLLCYNYLLQPQPIFFGFFFIFFELYFRLRLYTKNITFLSYEMTINFSYLIKL